MQQQVCAAQQADEADGRLRRPQLIGEALGAPTDQAVNVAAQQNSIS